MTQFDVYIGRWGLVADGEPIETPFSRLLPVRREGVALMLKLLLTQVERNGPKVLTWWDGHGAATVLEIDEGAILGGFGGAAGVAAADVGNAIRTGIIEFCENAGAVDAGGDEVQVEVDGNSRLKITDRRG